MILKVVRAHSAKSDIPSRLGDSMWEGAAGWNEALLCSRASYLGLRLFLVTFRIRVWCGRSVVGLKGAFAEHATVYGNRKRIRACGPTIETSDDTEKSIFCDYSGFVVDFFKWNDVVQRAGFPILEREVAGRVFSMIAWFWQNVVLKLTRHL